LRFTISAPTGKSVGSIDFIELEPMALAVGLQKIKLAQTFETASTGFLAKKNAARHTLKNYYGLPRRTL